MLRRSVIVHCDTIVGTTRDDGGHWAAPMPDGAEQRIGGSYADNVRRLTGRAQVIPQV